jgi:hypothetical protein
MAGALRKLNPTLAPTGRVIQLRQLVAGNPRESQLVEVRLGCREDKADYADGFCRARKKGTFDQCGRRPARNAVVCGIHGGGHAVRHRNGTRLSPQEAGRLSGLARRITRDGRVDLTQVPTIAPWLHDRANQLREQREQVDLRKDAVQLTALRDLLLSGQLDIDPLDLVRALAMLTQVKANALRAKFLLDTADMVTGPRFRDVVTKLIELMRAFVPEERHAEVARELALLGARVPPATES